MDAADIRRVEVAGSTLVVERWAGPALAPTVVLLHAGICDRRSWYDTVPLLAASMNVVAYDRRGFGESPPSAAPFRHLDDLIAVLDATTRGPVWLVGSSMGGRLALDAALAIPDRIAGVVVIAPAVSGAPEPDQVDADTQRLGDLLEAAAAADDHDRLNDLEMWVWLDGPAGPQGRVSGPARELALAMNAVVMQSGMAEDAGESGVLVWDRLAEITVPITMACGELDVPFLLEQCRQAADRLGQSSLQLLPGVAHLPYLEDPALVAGLVTDAIALS